MKLLSTSNEKRKNNRDPFTIFVKKEYMVQADPDNWNRADG